jgi:hypothetical protein
LLVEEGLGVVVVTVAAEAVWVDVLGLEAVDACSPASEGAKA